MFWIVHSSATHANQDYNLRLALQSFQYSLPKIATIIDNSVGCGSWGRVFGLQVRPLSSKADGFKANPTLLEIPSLLSCKTRWEQPQARMPHFQSSYLKSRKTFLVINCSQFFLPLEGKGYTFHFAIIAKSHFGHWAS